MFTTAIRHQVSRTLVSSPAFVSLGSRNACRIRSRASPHPFAKRFLSNNSKTGVESSTGAANASASSNKSWLQRFLEPKEMPPRGTFAWYREMVLICTVFAVTGSSTMMLVRPAVKNVLGLDGSFKDGPWSYRISSIVVMSPIYSVLLVIVGTIFGRHAYFRFFSVKMLSRFGIPPELMDKSFHETKKTFRKW